MTNASQIINLGCRNRWIVPVVLSAVFLLSVAGEGVLAQELENSCAAREVGVEDVTATAGSFANIGNLKGSIRYESDRMLGAAVSQSSGSKAAERACSDGCVPEIPPITVFRVVPAKFLEKYSDMKTCAKYYADTKASPIEYQARNFRGLESLSGWINDFSQGKGSDGEDLYEKCPGSCSPQYEYLIEKNGSGFRAGAMVICGPARDKWDNQYILSSAIRYNCRPSD